MCCIHLRIVVLYVADIATNTKFITDVDSTNDVTTSLATTTPTTTAISTTTTEAAATTTEGQLSQFQPFCHNDRATDRRQTDDIL